jgi:hypothetical protein
MIKISDDMKEMIKIGNCTIATSSREGWPNIGPKGSVIVIDDETLAWGELVGRQTYGNVLENPKVAIAVVDHARRIGYRFIGHAKIETEGSLYDKFASFFEKIKLPKPKAAIRVKVSEIYDLSVKNPGGKIS